MSKIEWTDETWNPIVGCSPVSEGCRHCYAAKMAWRLAHICSTREAYEGLTARNGAGEPSWTGKVRLIPERLERPLRWRKPRRIFVCSMGDLFHKDVSLAAQRQVFRTMAKATGHTFQVLTKRPALAAQFLAPSCGHIPNVWLGTSVESAKHLDRIDHLRDCPAAVRFLSCEPLLGPLGKLDLTGIHWVIVGGESGPGARPMKPDWAREIRDQCVAQGVPLFFKQWGEWSADRKLACDLNEQRSLRWVQKPGWRRMYWVTKKIAGRHLDGRIWDEMPGGTP